MHSIRPFRALAALLCLSATSVDTLAQAREPFAPYSDDAIQTYNQADRLFQRGDTAGAIPLFDKALQLEPKMKEAYSGRGACYATDGDLARAISDFTKSIEIDPSGVTAFVNRGMARRDSGDVDGSIEDFQRAIDLDPTDAPARLGIGIAHHIRGDKTASEAALTEYLKLVPDGQQDIDSALNRLKAPGGEAEPSHGQPSPMAPQPGDG